ncbi:MAG TPA: hypothetical protein PLG55_10640 [Methanospirillum sp.]|uniref:hypothetical protein n=1 Tax=Methanospirillum sp. TaxID=45200 RepID=UPI002CDA303E|nr:hypothetical protein [Methanospirillum sp.]HPY61166.1 hypothetical protein [Methanospirillum sp.]
MKSGASWIKTGDNPIIYTYSGDYLFDEEVGKDLGVQILADVDAGKQVVIDLIAGTHAIHHHFYYGLLNYCIEQGREELFTPGSPLAVSAPIFTIDTWSKVLEMYRKKGYLPDPLGLNEMPPEEYMKKLNEV